MTVRPGRQETIFVTPRNIAAIQKLDPVDSKYQLRDIAKSDKDPSVRIVAIQKLDPVDSKYQLRDIAKSDPDPRVRFAAVQKLEP